MELRKQEANQKCMKKDSDKRKETVKNLKTLLKTAKYLDLKHEQKGHARSANQLYTVANTTVALWHWQTNSVGVVRFSYRQAHGKTNHTKSGTDSNSMADRSLTRSPCVSYYRSMFRFTEIDIY